MSNTAILTTAGKKYLASKALANQGLDIDRMILANIPGLDESAARNPNMALPALAQIEHEAKNLVDGFVDDNTIAWAATLGADVGDFDYNFVALVTTNNTMLAMDYLPLQRKRQGVNNVHNRSFVLQFAAAKQLSQITIPAKSWMFDYSQQMDGLLSAVIGNATLNFRLMLRQLREIFSS